VNKNVVLTTVIRALIKVYGVAEEHRDETIQQPPQEGEPRR
jgi:hypothetical protein